MHTPSKPFLFEGGAMYTSAAVAELTKREPDVRKYSGNTKCGTFVELYPDMFNLQTASSGGASKVMLK